MHMFHTKFHDDILINGNKVVEYENYIQTNIHCKCIHIYKYSYTNIVT